MPVTIWSNKVQVVRKALELALGVSLVFSISAWETNRKLSLYFPHTRQNVSNAVPNLICIFSLTLVT